MRLKPEKLSVEFRKVKKTKPVIPRKYTLTHSDQTGELFLTIGNSFALEKINPLRDEVLATWQANCNGPYLFVQVYVGQFSPSITIRRNNIFIKELPLALEAFRYGDNAFFRAHPFLDNAPIYIHFVSLYPAFNRIEFWETPKKYQKFKRL